MLVRGFMFVTANLRLVTVTNVVKLATMEKMFNKTGMIKSVFK